MSVVDSCAWLACVAVDEYAEAFAAPILELARRSARSLWPEVMARRGPLPIG